MKSTLYTAVGIWLVLAGAFSSAGAADWQWPTEVSIAGFNVTSIRGGSVDADGSGSAIGTLQIRGVTSQRVSLSRSARGDITGAISMNTRIAGVELQAGFALDSAGLKAKGATIKTAPRPITDALVSVDTSGQFNGTGKVELGAINMPARFTISGGSFGLSGSAATRAQVDTPLATYSFSGDLKLDASAGRLGVTAKGTVQRTGKLSNQVSSWQVSDVQVNPADGLGKVNVDGVDVVFDFFRP